ncbi:MULTISPECIES: hypothetical protein [Paenibacillus]|uniref:hypothetical protein n=1 Tax=Paenibacillus TaxID=44249 RepID=UPI00040C2A57|nr:MULTISPECIES: hypothetical protein [Paenibacillus]KAF6620466.1 hypothetical protein HFE00_05275 [Paenibacillus sp. EKM101P]KAF6623458.1 hypothetical protein HFE03_07370 [Paenibacillus sp. EKM102P]KAF6633980.1 hypothetical protein HFE01_07140 [Paenibacillus sp. EKM10P]KAF6649506.1 hypothetical protein HFE02_02100 [Paenibacillus sp. EKM11P]
MNNMFQIDRINELQGINTKELNMFSLHELYVDGVPIAYVRINNEKIEVLPFLKFAAEPCKALFVNTEEFGEMIEGYRVMDCLMYNSSNFSNKTH